MNRLLAVILAVACCAGCTSVSPGNRAGVSAGGNRPGLADGLYAEITTPRGVMLCELYFEKAPLTVMSFVGLAEGTLGPAPRKPFFDGLTFHRVVPGFVIQGGDPTGTGAGGPGYRFPDEFAAGLRHKEPGVLSMANSGPDTNGSQFFVTLGEARYLDYVHSIFGRVIRGQDVPSQIQTGDRMQVKILRRGRAARRFQADEKSFTAAVARASRAKPPHLVDRTLAASAGAPWQSKYIEYRLSNLARFTGRHIYIRLFDGFAPESAEQTEAEFAAETLSDLHAPPGTLLACYFAAEDRWTLTGAGPGIVLPALDLPPLPRGGGTSPEGIARQQQGRIYTSVGQVISSLIDQTDPK